LHLHAIVNPDAPLTLDSLTTVMLRGTVNAGRLIIGPDGHFTMQPVLPPLDIYSRVENEGRIDVVGPSNTMQDSLINLPGALLRIDAGDPSYLSADLYASQLRNGGTVELINTNAASSAAATRSGFALLNESGGTLLSAAGAGTGGRILDAPLDNRGTVTVAHSLSLPGAFATHVNDGIVRLTSGDLTVSGASASFTNRDSIVVGAGRTLTVTGGSFSNASTPTAGVIAGTGTVDVSGTGFANDGVLAPGLSPGILGWLGALPFGSASVLDIELAGTTPGTQYDRLDASGSAATLGGTLNVSFTGGFTPAGGEQFTVFTFGSHTGDFATVNLPALSGGLTWQRTLTPTSMVLTVSGAFVGAPPGTDVVWTGGSSTNWTDPANWVPAVPGTGDDVWIRADAPNQPVVTGVRVVDSLTVQGNATVTVPNAADTLVVGGSLDGGSPGPAAFAGSGAVRLTGAGQTVRGRLPSLAVTGTIAAADSVLVTGNLAVSGSGDFDVGPHAVTVGAAFSTSAAATLTMQNAGGRVNVVGPATFGGGSTAGRLTAGTLRLLSDLAQSGDPQSFAPSGAHLTVLNGTGGTLTFATPAQSGGSHFHHLTVDMAGTASNGGELVVNGNLNISDNDQFAPSGIVGGSGNRITVVGSATISQNQTAAVLTSDVLRFGGAVNRVGGAVVDGDTVEFFGTSQTVPTNLSSAFALKVTGNPVLFTGATSWRGMLVAGSGRASIGAATVSVDSTFTTAGSGTLEMADPAGVLSVGGTATFGGGSTVGLLTAGTLDLRGSFTQTGGTSATSFAASGTHLTHFNNPGFTEMDPMPIAITVGFANPDVSAGSRFHDLTIDQGIDATFNSRVAASGAVAKPVYAGISGSTLEVLGDLTLDGAQNGAVFLDTALVGGVFMPNLSSQDYSIATVVFTGSGQTVPVFPHFVGVVIRGDSVVVADGATMLGLVVDGTGMADIGGNVQTGNFETRDQGRLRQTGGSLFVQGNATFGGGSTAGLLTGGTLSVTGNFTQTGSNSTSAFSASGSHVTELVGSSPQTVDFGDPDFSASRFEHLMIAGSGGANFASDAVAAGQLRTPAIAGGITRTVSGSGTELLWVLGLDADSLVVDGVALQATDGAPIVRFDDITFANQNPGLVQLTLARAAGDHVFSRITFQTTPDPGSAYISLTDADGTAATPFSVTMDQPSPADPGGFAFTDDIAILNWPLGARLLGTVRNAVGGVPIAGAAVDLKAGPNATENDPTVQSTVTDGLGAYSLNGLATGDYTLFVSASGFITGSVAGIALVAPGADTVDVALSPLQQSGETRIVLSWSASPPDLDSYLLVPDTLGGAPFYVYYGSPGDSGAYPFSRLDNDVTSGYGPETITIQQQLQGVYQYRVHDYTNGDDAGSTALLASEARVDVYQNNTLVQTFTVPNAPGTLWTVFELDGGTITPINTMSGDVPAPAQLGGTVRTAVGGLEIFNALVELKAGANATENDPTLLSTFTDDAGGYTFSGLTPGNYTIYVSASGFVTANVMGIVLNPGQAATVDVALSPVQPAGRIQVVLSWGATPLDLDAYLLVPDTSGGSPFPVSYASLGDSTFYPYATLDNDVTSGFGPETITIYEQVAGVYQFRVHDFNAGDDPASTTLLASQARVDVYRDNTLTNTFTVPNQPGSLWTVFELSGGVITPIGTISGDPPVLSPPGAAMQSPSTVKTKSPRTASVSLARPVLAKATAPSP